MKIFLELMWFFKQEKKAYLTGISILLIVALLQLIPPRIIGWVVDEITAGKLTSKRLVIGVSLLFGATLVMYFLRFAWRLAIFGSAARLARMTRARLFEHFTNLPMSFYQRKRTGDLMAHATNDISAIQQSAGFGVLSLFDSLSTGIIVALTMLTIDWRLTIVALIPMPIMALLTNYYGGKLFKSFHDAQEAFSDMNDRTQESINGIKVIKSFGQEEEDIAAFVEQSGDVLAKNYRVAKIDGLFDPTISFISGICFMLSLGYGGYLVVSGDLSVGQLVTFTTYLGLLVWPMLAFGFLFNVVERGHASYDRIKALLAEEVEIADAPNVVDEMPSGAISYHISRFAYPVTDRLQTAVRHEAVDVDVARQLTETIMLENIHFRINQGDTLGIVGKTGAGKSTLIKLLMREFDYQDGVIEFGGKSITCYRINNLRSAIGYVPQDHFLFSTTIRENIAFSAVETPTQKVREAARLASIDTDILSLPDGYDTVVGERGVSLSGGQKQRISIARALLMDAEVLILDDSLSAVDAKTEETILQNLREHRKDKTTIITAHRLSAIKHAQLILVMDEGKITQSGTHDQLMKMGGWYREMVERQQLEALVEMGG